MILIMDVTDRIAIVRLGEICCTECQFSVSVISVLYMLLSAC